MCIHSLGGVSESLTHNLHHREVLHPYAGRRCCFRSCMAHVVFFYFSSFLRSLKTRVANYYVHRSSFFFVSSFLLRAFVCHASLHPPGQLLEPPPRCLLDPALCLCRDTFCLTKGTPFLYVLMLFASCRSLWSDDCQLSCRSLRVMCLSCNKLKS